jgi:hypothetical protein
MMLSVIGPRGIAPWSNTANQTQIPPTLIDSRSTDNGGALLAAELWLIASPR